MEDTEKKGEATEAIVVEETAETAPVSVFEAPVKKEKPIYLQLALPISILIASLLISGTIYFTRGGFNNAGTANIAGGAKNNVELKLSNSDHVLGNKDAKATIVEFADFRCPYCQKFFQSTEQQLIKDYVDTGKVKFIFKNYAFLGTESISASEAAECTGEQNKYWEFYNWLFTNQAPESDLAYYTKANLIKYAAKVGISNDQFNQCLNSGKYQKHVSDDTTMGSAVGVSGTPTFFVIKKKNYTFDTNLIKSQLEQRIMNIPMGNGNTVIIGAQEYTTFKNALEAALK